VFQDLLNLTHNARFLVDTKASRMPLYRLCGTGKIMAKTGR
jgi:hypothetical protein